MPCMGPSPEEERDMEVARNTIDYGVPWDSYTMAVNVACAFGKYADGDQALPSWAIKWWTDHKRRDALKRAAEAEDQEHQTREEYKKLRELADKHGYTLTKEQK